MRNHMHAAWRASDSSWENKINSSHKREIERETASGTQISVRYESGTPNAIKKSLLLPINGNIVRAHSHTCSLFRPLSRARALFFSLSLARAAHWDSHIKLIFLWIFWFCVGLVTVSWGRSVCTVAPFSCWINLEYFDSDVISTPIEASVVHEHTFSAHSIPAN